MRRKRRPGAKSETDDAGGVINVPQVSDPQLSPDGHTVLYVEAEANWKADNLRLGKSTWEQAPAAQ